MKSSILRLVQVAQTVKHLLQCRGPEFDPWVGRSPGEGNGNPLQYSCLENPMDRGAWWATVHGVAKELDTTERLKHTHNKLVRGKPLKG